MQSKHRASSRVCRRPSSFTRYAWFGEMNLSRPARNRGICGGDSMPNIPVAWGAREEHAAVAVIHLDGTAAPGGTMAKRATIRRPSATRRTTSGPM
jgi:hypothetical protein